MSLIESKNLPTGWNAIDFKLEGTDERSYSLQDFNNKRGLLIIFTCNHCPYARAAWPTTIGLHKKYGGDIAFVAISANDAEEYPDDSFEEMKKKTEEWDIPFPYLYDETQEIARAYDAQCTPDLYLFKNENGSQKLFYHGRVASEWEKPALADEKNLEDALERLTKDEAPPENQPPAMGCSIKWKN